MNYENSKNFKVKHKALNLMNAIINIFHAYQMTQQRIKWTRSFIFGLVPLIPISIFYVTFSFVHALLIDILT